MGPTYLVLSMEAENHRPWCGAANPTSAPRREALRCNSRRGVPVSWPSGSGPAPAVCWLQPCTHMLRGWLLRA